MQQLNLCPIQASTINHMWKKDVWNERMPLNHPVYRCMTRQKMNIINQCIIYMSVIVKADSKKLY